jgi:dienelactone hydrolase
MRLSRVGHLIVFCVLGLAACTTNPPSPGPSQPAAAAPQAGADDGSSTSPGEPQRNILKQRVIFESDGLKLVALVFKPPGPGPFPAIVWNHGSERNPGVGPMMDTIANAFVPQGYVVFAPLRRGHGFSEGTYIGNTLALVRQEQGIEAANREMVDLLQGEQLDDQLAGLAYLKQQPYIDTSRLVVAGCSYGGIESLLAAERDTGYRAAVAISPGSLSWDDNPDLQKRLVDGVSHINIPVLILQPAKDKSLQAGLTLQQEFERQGKPVSEKNYSGRGTEQEQTHCFGGNIGVHIWSADALAFISSAVRN